MRAEESGLGASHSHSESASACDWGACSIVLSSSGCMCSSGSRRLGSRRLRSTRSCIAISLARSSLAFSARTSLEQLGPAEKLGAAEQLGPACSRGACVTVSNLLTLPGKTDVPYKFYLHCDTILYSTTVPQVSNPERITLVALIATQETFLYVRSDNILFVGSRGQKSVVW